MFVHYYLQYDRDCQIRSECNKDNNMSCTGSIVDAQALIADVDTNMLSTGRVVPHITNSHSLYDCRSTVDLITGRYKNVSETPDICQFARVQTIAFLNWYVEDDGTFQVNLVYVYPKIDSQFKGFYSAKYESIVNS